MACSRHVANVIERHRREVGYVRVLFVSFEALVTVNERAREPSAATCRRLANGKFLDSIVVCTWKGGV